MNKLVSIVLLATILLSFQGGCKMGQDTQEFMLESEELENVLEQTDILEVDSLGWRSNFQSGFRRASGGFRFNRKSFGDNIRGFGRNARNGFRNFEQNARNGFRGNAGNFEQNARNIGQNAKDFGNNLRRRASTSSKAVQDISKSFGDAAYKQWTDATSDGSIAVTSQLQQYAKGLCLTTQFFCYVDCVGAFGMNCKVADAQIYSIRIPKEQHESKCVAPRKAAGAVQDPSECELRPCPCSLYEPWFYATSGKKDYDQALAEIQGQCSTWCTTGVQPAGVWNKAQFEKKMSPLKKLGKAIGKIFKSIGKAVGKLFRRLGRIFRRW